MSIDPATLLLTVALNAASMAVAGLRTINGPRLADLSVTVADYGTPMNYLLGERRLELPVFYAEPIKETRRRRKGKGAKYNEYVYSGTFACVGADHEIAEWLKVFLDRRLAYDAQGTVGSDSYNARQYMRFYLGTEDQEADERMVAYVESLEGPDTCPAYLGVAYVMFEDLPLEPFGNRFPQVSAVLLTEGDPAFPYTDVDATYSGGNLFFTGDFDAVVAASYYGFSIINVQDLEILQDRPGSFAGIDTRHMPWEDGYFLALNDGPNNVVKVDFFGNVSLVQSGQWRYFTTARTDDGVWHWGARQSGAPRKYYIDGAEVSGVVDGNMVLFAQRDGSLWVVAGNSTDDVLTFFRIAGGVVVQSWSLDMGGGGEVDRAGVYHYVDDIYDHLIFEFGGSIYAVDTRSQEVVHEYSAAHGVPAFRNIHPDAKTMWGGFYEIRMDTFELVRTVDPGDWGLTGINYQLTDFTLYDRVNNALVKQSAIGTIWIFLDRFEPGTIRLRDVCNEVARRCGLSSDEYDFSDLDQILRGYSWTQGAGRDILEHLLELYDSDVRPNGFVIEGIKRGKPVEGDIIPKDMFVRTDQDRYAYELTIVSETDLPMRVYATYADQNADQQPNTVISQRASYSVESKREHSFDLNTLALEPDDAQPLVERALRRLWIGSVKGSLKLPPNYLSIIPGDVRDFGIEEDITIRGRCTRTVISPNRLIALTFERDRAAANTLRDSPGGEASGRPPQQTFNSVETILFILDVPLLSDAHDQSVPFLYVAAGPLEDGDWPGTDVQRSLSGTAGSFDAGWDSVGSSEAVTWGTVETPLPATLTTVIDYGSQMIVVAPGGTFTSATEDEILNDPTVNQLVYGDIERWEIMQFIEAELIDEDTWLLTGFVRGQRGTERFVDTHAAGDYVILTAVGPHKHDLGADKIDDTDYYKAITFGRVDTDQPAREIDFAAEANRPLSPVYLTIERDPVDGSFDISFTRRTRIGAASLDGHDVPVGETSEAYILRVLGGSSEAVRTENLTSTSWRYDDYLQIEDFGSPQSFITVSVAQVSPSLNIEGEATVATG